MSIVLKNLMEAPYVAEVMPSERFDTDQGAWVSLTVNDLKTSLSGIATINEPILKNQLLIIKDRAYLKKFLTSLSQFQSHRDVTDLNSLVIIGKKELCEELALEAKGSYLLLGASVVEVLLAAASKLFYEVIEKNEIQDPLKNFLPRIDPTVKIYPNVTIENGVTIGRGAIIHPGCYIGRGVEIADEVELFSHVVLYPRVKVLTGARIHAHTVIGADGFGYFFYKGKHLKIWHYGGVLIGAYSEIGANTSIDSGTFTPTIIGEGCIIDNQVQIGHNVKLGRGVVLCGQVGIAGSAELGDFTVLGGRAAIGPMVKVGDQSQVAAGAMVNKDWPSKSQIAGHPARDLKEWFRTQAIISRIVKEELREK